MSDVVPFPADIQRAIDNAPAETLRLKVTTELVLLQVDLAVIGHAMAVNNEPRAERVMDASTWAGRIWDMLR